MLPGRRRCGPVVRAGVVERHPPAAIIKRGRVGIRTAAVAVTIGRGEDKALTAERAGRAGEERQVTAGEIKWQLDPEGDGEVRVLTELEVGTDAQRDVTCVGRSGFSRSAWTSEVRLEVERLTHLARVEDSRHDVAA